ncbi:hypothetical protein [Burkholderia guangdongensis]|uniref:hypothetical protein n=1 Tax=Burkholderia guangdongensis TaxID=1792500 RepID=UPI0015CA71CD|nr:hypothetical protein [Burkholderia guangdongensis]
MIALSSAIGHIVAVGQLILDAERPEAAEGVGDMQNNFQDQKRQLNNDRTL